MNKKPSKLWWLIPCWGLIFLALLVAANHFPQLKPVDQPDTTSYTHPYDHYTVILSGTWQVSQAKEQSLTLVDLDADSTIRFTLEVGGRDDKTLAKCAKLLMKAVKAKQDIDFDADSIAVAGGAYAGIHFSGSVMKDGKEYVEEFFLYHPNEGIRLYAVYVHPVDTDDDAATIAADIITSLNFTDFNEVYKAYLK